MNKTPTKEQVKKKYENLQHSEAVKHFMEINAAQAQEIDELKAHVNALRMVARPVAINLYTNADGVVEREVDQLFNLNSVVHQIPAQSLAAHNIKLLDRVHDEVLDNCTTAEECREAVVNMTLDWRNMLRK